MAVVKGKGSWLLVPCCRSLLIVLAYPWWWQTSGSFERGHFNFSKSHIKQIIKKQYDMISQGCLSWPTLSNSGSLERGCLQMTFVFEEGK